MMFILTVCHTNGRGANAASACSQDLRRASDAIKRLEETASSTAEAHASEQKEALAKIAELTDKVSTWQAEHAAAVERGDSLEARGKEDVESYASQLEQLRAELAKEKEGRAADASSASTLAEELNATIKSLQETACSTAETHASEQTEASAKIAELTDKVSTWQAEHAAAVERGDSLEARGKEDVDSYTSQLEQLRAEFEKEKEGRAADASSASTLAEELNATVKSLQETACSTAETHASEQKEALAKIAELTDKVSTWQAEHAAAVERGDSLEARGKEDVESYASQLEQLRAEFATEKEGRAADASKASAFADELNATIERLQNDPRQASYCSTSSGHRFAFALEPTLCYSILYYSIPYYTIPYYTIPIPIG